MYHHRIYLFILCILPVVILQGQIKRALVVGISQYPLDAGFEDINGANDIPLICKLLTKKEFHASRIATLCNQQATKKNIMQQLNRIYTHTGQGDIIYLHFSCHGQQMWDDNGDEKEEDGLDESIVPYDARIEYEPGIYTGQNHIRDDEMNLWIKKIQQKAGEQGQVIVTVDACHSGTISRKEEDMYIRGTTKIFAPEGFITPQPKCLKPNVLLERQKGWASVCVFSSCLPHQTNMEHSSRRGLLALAFSEVVPKLAKKTSFQQLFNRLQKKNLEYNTQKHQQTFYFESSNPNTLFLF